MVFTMSVLFWLFSACNRQDISPILSQSSPLQMLSDLCKGITLVLEPQVFYSCSKDTLKN